MRRCQFPTHKKTHTHNPAKAAIPRWGMNPSCRGGSGVWFLMFLPYAACNEGPGHSAPRGRWVFSKRREHTAQDDTEGRRPGVQATGVGVRWGREQHGSSKALAKGVGRNSDT